MESVILLGYGNVGQHLFKGFIKAKVNVIQVFSPNLKPKIHRGVIFTNNKTELKKASIYIITVPDQAIENVAHIINNNQALILHTAGAVPLSVLKKFKRRGVFYPLQSFSKNRKVNWKEIPICIESSTTKDLEVIKSLALKLSLNVIEINSHKRKTIHLAAVWANNFTNHIFNIAHQILETEKIDFSILLPLMKETVLKLEKLTPDQAQTGPAIRGDAITINEHLKQLEHTPYGSLYKQLTTSIKHSKLK